MQDSQWETPPRSPALRVLVARMWPPVHFGNEFALPVPERGLIGPGEMPGPVIRRPTRTWARPIESSTMQTTAWASRNPACLHSSITAMPSTTTTDKLTVNESPPFLSLAIRQRHRPASQNARRALRRDQRALRTHFAHGSAPSRTSTAQAHSGPGRQPSRRDLTVDHLLKGPAQASLLSGDRAARRSPDTIGTGERRSLAGTPTSHSRGW